MQPSDLKSVSAVERAAYAFPWSLGIFRDCLLAGYYCLVLDVGKSVTGYGIMSIAAAEAHLLNLCVHPNAQRLGYGRRLLNALLLKAEDAGVEKIFLEVRPSNLGRVTAVPLGRIRSDRHPPCLLSGRARPRGCGRPLAADYPPALVPLPCEFAAPGRQGAPRLHSQCRPTGTSCVLNCWAQIASFATQSYTPLAKASGSARRPHSCIGG